MKPDNTPLFDLSLLKPGDHLLYWTPCLVDFIIGLKTFHWGEAGHIEGYDGDGYSVAARAEGVKRYPIRWDGLMVVRRPVVWDHAGAMKWFYDVADGQGYDWVGLLSFGIASGIKSEERMFCSETMRNWDAAAGCPSFDKKWEADRTPPMFYMVSPAFQTIYRRKTGGLIQGAVTP